MAGEQFSLCWDNFHKNMSSGMHSLLESEDLVDVTLAVEGKYLKAHKMVLSVCSPYFRELFQSNPCKHPIVFMKDVSYTALNDLLTFMYQGEVQVNQENLATFIKTAEALQIKGLTGDGNGDISDIPEEIQTEETTSKRTIHNVEDQKATHRPKKPATYPAKRPKLLSPESKVLKTESACNTPSAEQIIQFKMEPYESGDQSNTENLDDSQADNFADDMVDDAHIEDPEDYSMLEGEEEPQASTSGDGIADNQDDDSKKNFVACVRRKPDMPRYIVDGFVFHVNIMKGNPPMSYLRCMEYKRLGCHARAVIPSEGSVQDIQLKKPHNHPPDHTAEEKIIFMRELKDYLLCNDTCTSREIYNLLSPMYPNAARELPYVCLRNKMNRWRRTLDRDTVYVPKQIG